MKHTPTPWEVRHAGDNTPTTGIGPIGYASIIATLYDHVLDDEYELSEPNAVFIVRACNNFDPLLAACNQAYEYIAVKVGNPERADLFRMLEQAIDRAEE